MKHVAREELLDYQTYTDRRDTIRDEALKAKADRRVHVGEHLTFLFENRITVRYQVQEMMRVERIVRESDILHELQTYNELLGGPGELGCTLLIEIETEAERNRLLTQWLGLPEYLYLRMRDGAKVRASFDPRQVGETRLSSVQYLKFDVKGETPVAIGCDFESLNTETKLTEPQRAALAEDLEV